MRRSDHRSVQNDIDISSLSPPSVIFSKLRDMILFYTFGFLGAVHYRYTTWRPSQVDIWQLVRDSSSRIVASITRIYYKILARLSEACFK